MARSVCVTLDCSARSPNALSVGQAMSLEVDEIVHVEKSLFQDVLVFKSKHHGNVLCLDGVIQW